MKQIVSFVLLLSLFLFSSRLFAQTNYEDVVYLKNGSIIHGIIIEQVPNESIKIQTKDRNIFVYKMDEIQKLTKEEIAPVRKGREALTKDNIKKRGYVNITEIVFGRDILNNGSNDAITGSYTSSQQPSIGVQTVNGFLFNPHFSAGIGIGIHSYDDLSFVPIFADVRLNFCKTPVSPFVSLGAGYSLTGKEVYAIHDYRKYFGGVFLNPSAGIKFHFRKTKGMAFSIGYRYQEARIYVNQYYYDPYSNPNPNPVGWGKYVIGYLVMKIGFVF